jgi:hypothetical protein
MLTRKAVSLTLAFAAVATVGRAHDAFSQTVQQAGMTASSIKLSGAVAKTLTGNPVIAAWNKSKNRTGMTFSDVGTNHVMTGGVSFPGKPAVKTYTQTAAGSQSAVTVNQSPKLWIAVVGGNSPTQGSYTLTVTKVTQVSTNTSGIGYLVHGTLDAKLPAVAGTGASGSVTLHVTF